jgi:hypothetical protein
MEVTRALILRRTFASVSKDGASPVFSESSFEMQLSAAAQDEDRVEQDVDGRDKPGHDVRVS